MESDVTTSCSCVVMLIFVSFIRSECVFYRPLSSSCFQIWRTFFKRRLKHQRVLKYLNTWISYKGRDLYNTHKLSKFKWILSDPKFMKYTPPWPSWSGLPFPEDAHEIIFCVITNLIRMINYTFNYNMLTEIWNV